MSRSACGSGRPDNDLVAADTEQLRQTLFGERRFAEVLIADWNALAMSFYEKLGAKAMDEWMVFRITCQKLKKLVGES